MIKKISSIKNFAVFRNFDWYSSIQSSTIEFDKLNIIYGRNYSGKTTLSRIFRCFELGHINEKYADAEFELDCDEGSMSCKNLSAHSYQIRVFNKDFIKENLSWLVDEEKQ